ncbi:MAG: OmpA family protein [Pseudomonadota bacterium]
MPLLAMWVWISGLLEQENIQRDLRERSELALAAAGYSWAQPGYGYRDGLLNGTAPSGQDASEALDVVRGVWGVRVAEGSFNQLETVSDYTWTAERNGQGRVTLSGYVPDEDTRAAILDVMKRRFGDDRVTDKMVLAAGAPPTDVWLSGVRFGLDQLSKLSVGRLELDDTGLSLTGTAIDPEAYNGVKGALRSRLPNGFSLVKDSVIPPRASPYDWSAEKSATQLVLSGFAPSAVDRKTLFNVAKASFPNLAIIDRMELASGQPVGLAAAARVSLEQLALLNLGRAKLTDEKIVLSGEAADQLSGGQIETAFKTGLPGNFSPRTDIAFATVIPPSQSPYTTGLDVTADLVRLTGYVPSDESRQSILNAVAAAFPGRRIDDRLELGSGQPEGWRACFQAGLSGLKILGGGIASLEDRTLEVRGKSDDETVAEGLPADVRAAANRSCATDVKVVVNIPPEPDLTWRARRDETVGLVLEGEVPDAETRAMLVSSASKLFPDMTVVDRMRVAGGYAKKWRGISATGLSALAKLRTGEAVITGQELLVRGEAQDTAVAGAVKDQLAHTLAKGYRGRDIITVRSDAMIWAETEARRKAEEQAEAARKAAEAEKLRLEEEEKARQAEAAREAAAAQPTPEPEAADASRVAALQVEADACQDLLKSANSEGAIRFRFASSSLETSSRPTLNRLVEIAQTCPQFRIEIEGHTDAEGRPDQNLVLSQQRAQSVVDYLVGAGLPRSRLTAVGYGETRPVAKNNTAENRAKNRRIEFSVKVE